MHGLSMGGYTYRVSLSVVAHDEYAFFKFNKEIFAQIYKVSSTRIISLVLLSFFFSPASRREQLSRKISESYLTYVTTRELYIFI